MLALDSSRWSELRHAYGSAADIPPLLQQLRNLPRSEDQAEPWFTLWSALAHQGDVYGASFAAVPHVIEALGINPGLADSNYFQFPAWVEICRCRNDVEIPEDLREAYLYSLRRLPQFAATAAEREWDDELLPSVLAAIAVCKGAPSVAEAVLELDSTTAQEVLDWLRAR